MSEFAFENDFDLDLESLPPADLGEEHAMDRHMPCRPLRRSKPPIDFSGRYSTIGSDFNSSVPTSESFRHPHAPSLMSNSTLQNPSTAPLYSQKMYSFTDPFTSGPPNIPIHIITSLSVDQLRLHPHHLQLQQKYDHLCEVLAYTRRESSRDHMGLRVARSNTDLDGTYFIQFWPRLVLTQISSS